MCPAWVAPSDPPELWPRPRKGPPPEQAPLAGEGYLTGDRLLKILVRMRMEAQRRQYATLPEHIRLSFYPTNSRGNYLTYGQGQSPPDISGFLMDPTPFPQWDLDHRGDGGGGGNIPTRASVWRAAGGAAGGLLLLGLLLLLMRAAERMLQRKIMGSFRRPERNDEWYMPNVLAVHMTDVSTSPQREASFPPSPSESLCDLPPPYSACTARDKDEDAPPPAYSTCQVTFDDHCQTVHYSNRQNGGVPNTQETNAGGCVRSNATQENKILVFQNGRILEIQAEANNNDMISPNSSGLDVARNGPAASRLVE